MKRGIMAGVMLLCLASIGCKKKEEVAGDKNGNPQVNSAQTDKTGNEKTSLVASEPIPLTDPELEVSVNVDSLYRRLEGVIRPLLEKSEFNPQITLKIKQVLEGASQLNKLVVQGKITDQDMIFTFNTKAKEGSKAALAKYSIREPQLARFLPEDAFIRMQASLPTPLAANVTPDDMQKIADQLAQLNYRLTPLRQPLISLIQKWYQVGDGMEGAFSMGIANKNPDGIIVLYPNDPNKVMDTLVETARFVDKVGASPDTNSQSIAIEENKAAYGNNKKQVRHVMIKKMSSNSLFVEAIVFDPYVLVYFGSNTQALTNLVALIESGKTNTSSMKSMRIYPANGAFYADLNIYAMGQAIIRESGNPAMALFPGISNDTGTITFFANSVPTDAWFKMKIPMPLMDLLFSQIRSLALRY